MKKYLIVFSLLIIVFGFAGCSKKTSNNVDNADSAALGSGDSIPEPPTPPEPQL